jgi:hypothetical protein
MPQQDLPQAESTVERLLARACPDELDLARRTLGRLPPDRWGLEWQLPWWLAQGFGLSERVARDLVVGSVLGLVAIRLEDDLLDGDLEPADRIGARRLAPAALHAALAVFGRHVPMASPFWAVVDQRLAEWRTASPAAASTARGAPLKVPALAACLLAGRADAWSTVDRCLEHALAALVAYDQVRDWEADLAAGRWNAFVAAHAEHPQRTEWRDRNRISILVALLTRHAAAEAYAGIQADAAAAADLADGLPCEPLAAWLRSYAERTARQGEELERHYPGTANRAVELVFGRDAVLGRDAVFGRDAVAGHPVPV